MSQTPDFHVHLQDRCDAYFLVNDFLWIVQPWLTADQAADLWDRWANLVPISERKPQFTIGFYHRKNGRYQLTSTRGV